MKSTSIKLALVLSIVLPLIVSCKKNNDSSDPTPTLPKEWFAVKQNGSDTISVLGGYLYLSTKYNGTSSSAISLGTNNTIKGDFEMKLAFSSFHTSGSNQLSESVGFVLDAPGINNSLISGILSNSSLFLMDSTNADTQIKTTANRAGEFYVKRTNGNYLAWIRAGSDTLHLIKNAYFTGDLNLNISVSTLDNTATNTSVHIDDFTITGGGGAVASDPFDKNNITTY